MGKSRGSGGKSGPGVFSRKGISPASKPSTASKPAAPSRPATAATPAKPAQSMPATSSQTMSGARPPMGAPQKGAGVPGAPMPMGAPMAGAPAQGGALKSIAQTALGSMVGVMMADTVLGAMKGDKTETAAPMQDATNTNSVAPTAVNTNLQNEVCGMERMSFSQCLQANNNNLASCQWAFDMMNSCLSTTNGVLNAPGGKKW